MYICNSTLGFYKAGLEALISCMGGGRANQEAGWPQTLASVASAFLRSGEWGLAAQHLLAGLRYIYNMHICLMFFYSDKLRKAITML